MIQGSNTIQTGSHMLTVYPNRKAKVEDAVDFLTEGIRRNEYVILTTDDVAIREIRKKLKKKQIDIKNLEMNGEIAIKNPMGFHCTHGELNAQRTLKSWKKLVENSINCDKKGVRIFSDTSTFFKLRWISKIVSYDSSLGKNFSIPLTLKCAYDSNDVKKLTQKQFLRLKKNHNSLWKVDNLIQLDRKLLESIKLIMHYPHLIRVCKALDDKEMYTREILEKLSGWQYSHKYLKFAIKLKLIKLKVRKIKGKRGQMVKFHKLTSKGKKLLNLAMQINS